MRTNRRVIIHPPVIQNSTETSKQINANSVGVLVVIEHRGGNRVASVYLIKHYRHNARMFKNIRLSLGLVSEDAKEAIGVITCPSCSLCDTL